MADASVRLTWTGGGLVFDGATPRGASLPIDGDGQAGASPVELLLLSLAGCMGADVVDIFGKMRLDASGVVVRLEGDRAPDPPRRFMRLRLTLETRGVAESERAKVERALALSRDTYCSVLHTLRPDLELETEIVLE